MLDKSLAYEGAVTSTNWPLTKWLTVSWVPIGSKASFVTLNSASFCRNPTPSFLKCSRNGFVTFFGDFSVDPICTASYPCFSAVRTSVTITSSSCYFKRTNTDGQLQGPFFKHSKTLTLHSYYLKHCNRNTFAFLVPHGSHSSFPRNNTCADWFRSPFCWFGCWCCLGTDNRGVKIGCDGGRTLNWERRCSCKWSH